MLAKKTSKNHITLPRGIANAFPGTEYFARQYQEQWNRLNAGQNNV